MGSAYLKSHGQLVWTFLDVKIDPGAGIYIHSSKKPHENALSRLSAIGKNVYLCDVTEVKAAAPGCEGSAICNIRRQC